MRPIYVTGHKNPDTDSIISSIAYAHYKNCKGEEAIASRIGPVAQDTEYLLNRFGFEDPLHIYTAKSTIREIDFDKATLVDKDITLKEAGDKLSKLDTKTLFVADKNRELLGLVTLGNVSSIWLANNKELIRLIKSASLKNINKVLKGKLVVKPNSFKLCGLVDLSPIKNADLAPGTIAITSNPEKVEHAIEEKAGLIVVLDNVQISEKVLKKAKDADVAILYTKLSALECAKLIYLTPSVNAIMTPMEKLNTIKDSMTTDEAISIVSNSRARAYPIIDGHNKIIGSLSRYHLMNFKKKRLILVDHNEKKQSIDDIDDGDVIEIIDHHRFGGFASSSPINIVTQIVGATCTIVANKYFSENIKLEKKMAGLLLAGIVADTLNFKSPTTTDLDRETAKKLEKLTNEKADEIYAGIVASSASLTSKRMKDICFDDFKEFVVDGIKLGLSQAICKSYDELKSIRTPLAEYIDEVVSKNAYDLYVIMFTDPNGSGSYLAWAGKRYDLISKAFPKMDMRHFVNHLISRKKQLLPELIKAIKE